MRLSAAMLALVACGHIGRATGATCGEIHPAELQFLLRMDPPDPAPGELAQLDVTVLNVSGGWAGIPLFRLVGAEPLFAIEAQQTSYPSVEFARYWLRPVHPGRAVLRLVVNFETAFGCLDLPTFVFLSAASAPYVVAVRGDAATASATPTPSATPAIRTPPPGCSAAAPRDTACRVSTLD